jgi:hypothetical protein
VPDQSVLLVRYPEIAFGVFGRLTVGAFTCYTLELPWKGNQPGISCIPTGQYQAKRFFSPTFRQIVWRLEQVPGREGILIHPANRAAELKGCIAVGLQCGCVQGEWGLVRSQEAFRNFMEQTKEADVLHITIRWWGEGSPTFLGGPI